MVGEKLSPQHLRPRAMDHPEVKQLTPLDDPRIAVLLAVEPLKVWSVNAEVMQGVNSPL